MENILCLNIKNSVVLDITINGENKDVDDNDIGILITLELNSQADFLRVVREKSLYDKVCSSYQRMVEMGAGSFDLFLELKNKDLAHYNIFLDNDKFYLDGDDKDIIKFLNNNHYFANKKIILNKVFQVDRNQYEYLLKTYGNYSNVYFLVEGNEKEISLEDYNKTLIYVEELVSKIKSFNFSPFEELIYLYDFIRERKYQKEYDNEDYTESRDLTKVILGKKIVCLGYANLFSVVANLLGTSTKVFLYNGKNGEIGHARDIVYLKDTKYDIDGLYFCDLTTGSKKDDNTYLSDYDSFLQIYSTFKKYDSNFIDVSYGLLDVKKMAYFKHRLDLEEDIFSILFNDDFYNKLEYMLDLINNKCLLDVVFWDDKEKIKNVLDKIYDLANREIDLNKFLQALYNVRKIQYYEKPDTYMLDIDSLCLMDKEKSFYVRERLESMKKEIELIKLTRVLRNINDNQVLIFSKK